MAASYPDASRPINPQMLYRNPNGSWKGRTEAHESGVWQRYFHDWPHVELTHMRWLPILSSQAQIDSGWWKPCQDRMLVVADGL